MSLLALAAAVLLSQTEPAAEPAAPVPAAAADPATSAPYPVRPPRTPSPEELQRQLERIRKMPPEQSTEAMQDLVRKFPDATKPNPNTHVPDEHNPELGEPLNAKTAALTEAEQVKYAARQVFNSILAGDARSLVLESAFPFQLEDRRLEMPDELHKEWLKNLRAKRTDLLTLYDVEVFTPAEMEKKYGRPPPRLNAMPWKAPRTMIAVGNFSGHAAIGIFRANTTGRWMLVGYHD